MKTVILLTGCINPNGMPFTHLNDVSERQKQYVDAIHYYISNTDCEIVFCENSNTDISPLFENKQERLEILTFSGNQNKQRGKGYGEAEIIDYALQHSSFIQDNCIIIKITGRLIINNIRQIINSQTSKHDFVTCLFHSDLKFADSRIFCGTVPFYKEFLINKEKMNDGKGVFFEHVLASAVLESSFRFIPFVQEPLITGISGTTGESYQETTPNKKKTVLYKAYSWMQLMQVYKASTHRKLGFFGKIAIQFKIVKYKISSYFTYQ